QTGVDNAHLYVRKLKVTDFTTVLWQNLVLATDTGAGGADAEAGVTAMAVDTHDDSLVATGCARDANNHFGYFTIKYDSWGGLVWQASLGPLSQDTYGNVYGGTAIGGQRPRPVGVVIGPDSSPIVTGTLLDASGTAYVRTIKYTSGGFFTGADEFWN